MCVIRLNYYYIIIIIIYCMCPQVDVNIADITKLRPLHVAALHGDVRIASLLVKHGAAIDLVQVTRL